VQTALFKDPVRTAQ